MLFWYLFISVIVVTIDALPLSNLSFATGGPGYALQWNRLQTDIVSWQWDSVPQQRGLTIEFWFKHLDPFIVYSCPFNMGIDDFADNYMNPSEFSVYISPSYVGFWLIDTEYDCYLDFAFDIWYHLAITIDYITGRTRFYINGRLETTCNDRIDLNAKPRNHGLVVLGYEQLSLQGSLNADGAFDGCMDELRVWEGVRTPQEVSMWYNCSLDLTLLSSNSSSNSSSQLNFYFTFDNPENFPLLRDQTNSIVAKIGAIDSYVQRLSFGHKRVDTVASAPRFLISDITPFQGNGPVVISISERNNFTANFTLPFLSQNKNASARLIPNSNNMLWNGNLFQFDGSTINASSLRITSSSFSLFYRLPISGQTNRTFSEVLDKLMYSITDHTKNVSYSGIIIFVWGKNSIKDMHLNSGQDALNLVSLSGFDIHGHRMLAEISELHFGTILELSWDPSVICPFDPYESLYCAPPAYYNAETRIANMSVVNDFPFFVDNDVSAVFYQPEADFFGTTVAFRFRYISAPLETAEVTVSVAPENQLPVAQSLVVKVVNSSEWVTLNSSDPESSQNQIFYYVKEWPKFGVLKDPFAPRLTLSSSSSSRPLTPLSREEAPVLVQSDRLTLFHWAETVEDYSSSIAPFDWAPEQVLGAYNFFPSYGASPLAWQPDEKVDAWIIVGFSEALFLDQIEIFEVFNPGQVVKISASEFFVNESNSLSWETIWQSSASLNASLSAPRSLLPTIFSPPICPSRSRKQYVRIDIQQSHHPYEIDAIRITGGKIPQIGLLQTNRLIYQPAKGIHSAFPNGSLDSLTYVASDCRDSSASRTVTFLQQAPFLNHSMALATSSKSDVSRQSSTDLEAAEISVFRSYSVLVHVDSNENVFHFLNLSLFVDEICDDIFSRGVVVDCNKTRIEVLPPSGNFVAFSLNGNNQKVSSFPVRVEIDDEIYVMLLEKQTAQAVTKTEISVWIYNSNIVHRITINLAPDCSSSFGFMQLSEGMPCLRCDVFPSSLITTDEQAFYFAQNCPIPCSVSENTVIGLAVPTTIFLIATAACMVWTLMRSHSRVIYFSGKMFLLLQAGGLELCVLGLQLSLSDLCFSEWLVHFGMILCLTCAVAKCFRIERVFSLASKMKTSPWNLQRIRILILVPVIASLLLLIISEAVYPTVRVQGCCQYNVATIYVLLAFELFLAVVGSFLAFRTRNVPSRFNESRYLALVMYNALLSGLICIALYIIFALKYDATLTLQYAAFYWVSLFMILGNFGPKIYTHWNNPVLATVKLSRMNDSSEGSSDSKNIELPGRASKLKKGSKREKLLQTIEAEIGTQEQALVRTRNLMGKTLNALEDLRSNERVLKQRTLELVTELEYIRTHETVTTAHLSVAPVVSDPPL